MTAFEDFYGDADPPLKATRALPGTVEKLTILSQRASQYQTLWHPDDAH
jgi:hypothetical protein